MTPPLPLQASASVFASSNRIRPNWAISAPKFEILLTLFFDDLFRLPNPIDQVRLFGGFQVSQLFLTDLVTLCVSDNSQVTLKVNL